MSVMTFSKEENETICLYDGVKNAWIIESNVRKHITQIFKKYDGVKVLTTDEKGRPTSVKVEVSSKGISFRSLKAKQDEENIDEEIDE